MNYPKFAFLLLPYTRLELPGWGKLLGIAGAYHDQLWANSPTKTIKGKWHGYTMALDLSDWSDRRTYFLGRYYDLPTQLLIQTIVQPGDTFIDIGANSGMLTLLASRYVGLNGIVYAFEPNPEVFDKLKAAIIANQIKQVKLFQCGLSNQYDELTLSIASKYTGIGTFAEIPNQKELFRQYHVEVYRGDDILPKDLPGSVFVKIDVEGFEPYVLQGLSDTIHRFKPVIVTEVVEQHLKRAGSNLKQLFNLMQNYGYEGLNITTKRIFLKHRLFLSRVSNDSPITDDILWLHSNSDLWSKLAPLIVSQKSTSLYPIEIFI